MRCPDERLCERDLDFDFDFDFDLDLELFFRCLVDLPRAG